MTVEAFGEATVGFGFMLDLDVLYRRLPKLLQSWQASTSGAASSSSSSSSSSSCQTTLPSQPCTSLVEMCIERLLLAGAQDRTMMAEMVEAAEKHAALEPFLEVLQTGDYSKLPLSPIIPLKRASHAAAPDRSVDESHQRASGMKRRGDEEEMDDSEEEEDCIFDKFDSEEYQLLQFGDARLNKALDQAVRKRLPGDMMAHLLQETEAHHRALVKEREELGLETRKKKAKTQPSGDGDPPSPLLTLTPITSFSSDYGGDNPPNRLMLTLTRTTAVLAGSDATTGVTVFGDQQGVAPLEMWAITKIRARLGLVSRMNSPGWLLGLTTSLFVG